MSSTEAVRTNMTEMKGNVIKRSPGAGRQRRMTGFKEWMKI